jgi:histidinol-phosphate aminotransferase
MVSSHSIDSVLSLARPVVRSLEPYSSARSLGIRGEIFLDANENPWPPYPCDLSAEGVNRYPDPQPQELARVLSSLYNVEPSRILMGRGADESIDTLVRAFCEPNQDEILICPPTYGVYECAAKLQGAKVVRVPVTLESGFEIDPKTISEAWCPSVKLVFLCSPNNPTGNLVPKKTIAAVAESLLGKAIVVLDEAYIEFANQPDASSSGDLPRYPNLVILRTLSKAWALAGARCGVALAAPEIIDLLQKVRAPYPMTTPAVRTVLAALSAEGRELYRDRVRRLVNAREQLSQALKRLPQVEQVFPSEGNFILVKTTNAWDFFSVCLRQGIVVRDRSREANLANCVRISVGNEEDNEKLLQALKNG